MATKTFKTTQSLRRSACRMPVHPGQPSHDLARAAHGPHTQRGSTAIVVSAVLGVIAIMVMSFSSLAINKAAFGTEERMAREVDDALKHLETWYQRQADTLAAFGATPTEAQLQAVLPRPYPGMRLAMSSSMATPGCTSGTVACIPWRKIAAWYPATQTPGASVIQDGLPVSEFTGDAVWRIYSSQAWYFERHAKTQDQLNALSQHLMGWFTVRKALQPAAATDTHHWRASDCANPNGQIPCVDSYTPMTSSGVATLLGLVPADVTTPLGSTGTAGTVIEFSNLQDSSTTAPYTVSLRVSLPWGGQMRQTVLQP